MGSLAGRVDDDVNLVNAPTLAEERGIEVARAREPTRATSPTWSA